MKKKQKDKPASKAIGPGFMESDQATPYLIGALALIVGISYSYTLSGDVSVSHWDDQYYITFNPLIQAPLSLASIWDMFTKPIAGTFCGIPQLSWWLDYHLWGLEKFHLPGTPDDTKPGFIAVGFHATNMVLHIANTILVFLITRVICARTKTGPGFYSFIAFLTAFVFGIHPQRVESVAWLSERKDLVYALFFLLALYSYVSIGSRKWRLAATTGFFILSLLSKGQAVALVPTLLLIDHFYGDRSDRPMYFTLAGLALFFGIGAYMAQNASGAVFHPPIGSQLIRHLIFNTSYALWGYFQRFAFPANYSAFYQYPAKNPVTDVYLDPMIYFYPLFTIAAAWLVWRYRHNKAIVFGSGFFFVNILLLLQFIQVGRAIMADRYMYMPSIGLAFLAAAGLAYAARRLPWLAYGLCIVLVPGLMYATWQRSHIWQNDGTIWQDAINKDPGDILPYEQLAIHYEEDCHQTPTSLIYVDGALRSGSMNPVMFIYQIDHLIEVNAIDSAMKLCDTLLHMGTMKGARDSALLFQNRGICLSRLNKPAEAVTDLRKSLDLTELTPKLRLKSLEHLGSSYAQMQKTDSAILIYKEVYALEPHSFTQFDIATFYLRQGDTTSARKAFALGKKCDDIKLVDSNAVNALAKSLLINE